MMSLKVIKSQYLRKIVNRMVEKVYFSMISKYLKFVNRVVQKVIRSIITLGLDRTFLLGLRYVSWNVNYHNLIKSLPNKASYFIFLFTSSFVRIIVKLFRTIRPWKYTDADPYKIIYVDPSDIEFTTGEIYSKRRGWVVDGEWDKQGTQYMDRTYARAITERFEDGLKWEDTILAEKYDPSTLAKRGREIDSLYRSIRDNGYKSQKELLKQDPEAAWKGLNDAMHPLANEIAVDIGRNGELLWNICGQHRLAIAKVLGLEQIPVQVFRRHAKWQAIRENVCQSSGNHSPEHPDLVDLTD